MRRVYEYFADGYRMASEGERGIKKVYLCFLMALVHIFLVGMILIFSYFILKILFEAPGSVIPDDPSDDWDLR